MTSTNLNSFLMLPFFEERHRALAENISTWSHKEMAPFENEDEKFLSSLEFSRKLVSTLAKGGWLNYTIPAANGGAHKNIDLRSFCIIREHLAYHLGLADFSFAMQGLGSVAISLFGTETQRKKYLPAVGSGEAIAAFALSEPDAGSDVASLSLDAKAQGDHYILNGNKTWISNAGIAAFYIVFARTGEGAGAKGISAFIVDANSPGLEIEADLEVIAPHPLGSLKFQNCKVPRSQMVGAPGAGFKVAMASLDLLRPSVGACALGFAKRALNEALRYSKERKMFGQTLADFQITQAKLADMVTKIECSALMVYKAAWIKDSGADRITRDAALAKLVATEMAQEVIDAAVQIFGALGVIRGNTVERLYRDIRPLRIYEGATEVQKLIIARDALMERKI